MSCSLVSDIRSASRDLVRQFGFMHRTIAGTDLSASAVHTIIEIGSTKSLSAKDLCERLILEKSTVSRLVKSLVDRKEVCEVRSKDDGRMKYIQLTRKGTETLDAINNYAEAQVSDALRRLTSRSQQGILKGLQAYSAALKATSNSTGRSCSIDLIEVEQGYTPSIIGRVVEMLGSYMNENFGFGAAFEARIATDLAEFVSRIDTSKNKIWRAEIRGKIVGSIAIDGEDLQNGVGHLRWFIVDDKIRSVGVGNSLISHALDFCDNHKYRETHLWTVKGLDAARRLYEKHGFKLADEYYGDQWGTNVLEQKFVRPYRL